jgi:hypothetical protein
MILKNGIAAVLEVTPSARGEARLLFSYGGSFSFNVGG